MRRKDREITKRDEIIKIVDNCDVCRIGFIDDGVSYIVPLNFGYLFEDDKITLYFHGAKEGKKMNLISNCNKVGFEMDSNYKLVEGKTACAHSALYESIIGVGTILVIVKDKERQLALQKIMYKNTHKVWDITDTMSNSVAVFKIIVDSISAKKHS